MRREVGRELRDGTDVIVRNARRKAPKDEGQLTRGISRVDIGPLDYEAVSAAAYSAYMEFGTKSKFSAPAELAQFASQFKSRGPKIGFQAFFVIIKDWVRRKGIAGRFSAKTRKRVGGKSQQDAEDTAVAYAIAIHILRYGVNPHPFFFPAFFDHRGKIVKNVETVIKDIIK
jgi:hypothetical protein